MIKLLNISLLFFLLIFFVVLLFVNHVKRLKKEKEEITNWSIALKNLEEKMKEKENLELNTHEIVNKILQEKEG